MIGVIHDYCTRLYRRSKKIFWNTKIEQLGEKTLENIETHSPRINIIHKGFGDGLISYGEVAPLGYETLQLRNGVTLFFKEEQKECQRSTITQRLLTKPLSWCVGKTLKGMTWAVALVVLALRIPIHILSLVIPTRK